VSSGSCSVQRRSHSADALSEASSAAKTHTQRNIGRNLRGLGQDVASNVNKAAAEEELRARYLIRANGK